MLVGFCVYYTSFDVYRFMYSVFPFDTTPIDRLKDTLWRICWPEHMLLIKLVGFVAFKVYFRK